jgi:Zn ribbon nucleic-acid-binding protein
MSEFSPHNAGISLVSGESAATREIMCPRCHTKSRVTIRSSGGMEQYTCPHCGHNGTLGSTSKEGSSMADTSAVPDGRSVAALRHEASQATSLAEQQRLVAAADAAQAEILRTQAADREVELASSVVAHVMPGRVHELHTAATDWIGEVETTHDATAASNHAIARATVWYNALPVPVKADQQEFASQALGFASRVAGSFGEQADPVEHAMLDHVATLHRRDTDLGLFAQAGPPMPGKQGDPADTFTSGGGQNWLPGDATSSNRAPQLQELASPESQDLTPANDPGVGAGGPTPEVAAQERTGAASGTRATAVGPSDLEPFPRCAKCHNPVSPAEMAHTAKNEPVHGSCVGITGSNKEGQQMQTAPCLTCGGHGRVAVRQAPQPSITDIVAGHHHAYSGLPQIEQTVDPSDTKAEPTPLPPEVAFPWTMAPGQVENTIAEAERQIAERETRKGAARAAQAHAASKEAYYLAYNEVVRQTLARFDPQAQYDPQRRHASVHQHATKLAQAAAVEASRLVMRAGQDDSGWMGDMGQGGVGPGQQDGGNPPSTNLGQPDPVYGFGGDQPNRPLKPYGADEADDVTNNPGQNWQPGQPLQYDLGGRPMSTETPAGGGMQPKQSAADSDPEIQRALTFVRQRRAFLDQQEQKPRQVVS